MTIQFCNHAAHSAPGRWPRVTLATKYWRVTPGIAPSTPTPRNIHPMALAGRLEAMTAPTTEKLMPRTISMSCKSSKAWIWARLKMTSAIVAPTMAHARPMRPHASRAVFRSVTSGFWQRRSAAEKGACTSLRRGVVRTCPRASTTGQSWRHAARGSVLVAARRLPTSVTATEPHHFNVRVIRGRGPRPAFRHSPTRATSAYMCGPLGPD
jgi:hypothetical protein